MYRTDSSNSASLGDHKSKSALPPTFLYGHPDICCHRTYSSAHVKIVCKSGLGYMVNSSDELQNCNIIQTSPLIKTELCLSLRLALKKKDDFSKTGATTLKHFNQTHYMSSRTIYILREGVNGPCCDLSYTLHVKNNSGAKIKIRWKWAYW